MWSDRRVVKTRLGVSEVSAWISSCMASFVLKWRKNAGKIGVFGDVACFLLLFFGEVRKPRS